MREFPHTRTYPMKRRWWPLIVSLAVLLTCSGLLVWAYQATTGGEGGNW